MLPLIDRLFVEVSPSPSKTMKPLRLRLPLIVTSLGDSMYMMPWSVALPLNVRVGARGDADVLDRRMAGGAGARARRERPVGLRVEVGEVRRECRRVGSSCRPRSARSSSSPATVPAVMTTLADSARASTGRPDDRQLAADRAARDLIDGCVLIADISVAWCTRVRVKAGHGPLLHLDLALGGNGVVEDRRVLRGRA